MSESCYYKNYWGPELNTSKSNSRYQTESTKTNNGPRAVKTSIDGIDTHLVPSLSHLAPPSPPISDSEYNRLHDILYDTDLQFQASLLERWGIRVGRLTPWASHERHGLMQRWFTRIGHMTKAERSLFVDSSTLNGPFAKPFANVVNGDDKVANAENEEASEQGEASRDNASAFKNSEGQIDSTLCPTLINTWEIRANRKTPFPRAVADKLLTAWLGHESAWSDDERIIFYASHDPAVERMNAVSAEEKRRLLDILVLRIDDGAEPLLNGRYLMDSEPKPTSEEAADEVLATPVHAESEPATSEYEKELKRFLASDIQQHAKLVRETVGKNKRLSRLLKSDETVDANVIKQAIFPEPSFEITCELFDCQESEMGFIILG